MPELDTELKKNHPYIGTIEKTVFGGKGLLKIDDFVILLKNGIEGQKVEYHITKKKKNYGEGHIIKILEPSPLEIPESEQKNTLPGCTYQNISYESQLDIKTTQLKEIFRQFTDIDVFPVLRSPEEWEYRNKMEFSIGYEKMTREIIDGKKIWTDEGVAVGFHPPKNWSQVVSIEDVFIASKSVNILRKEFEEYLKVNIDSAHQPWNSFISKGFWRGIIFRESTYTKSVQINMVVSEKESLEFFQTLIDLFLNIKLPKEIKISGIIQTVHTGKNDAITNPEVFTLWGSDVLEEKLEDELKDKIFKISPFSFFQTNTKGAEILYSTIKQYVGSTKNKTVLDLFCGTGSIGIFCADGAQKVVGIELVEEAVEMAKTNALENGFTNTEFIAGKAEDTLPEVLEKYKFDTVIIDPPRSGMHPKALEMVSNLEIDRLIYISCNPTTLARDSEFLETKGWKLKLVQGVDMFPHTPHVECVSVVERVRD